MKSYGWLISGRNLAGRMFRARRARRADKTRLVVRRATKVFSLGVCLLAGFVKREQKSSDLSDRVEYDFFFCLLTCCDSNMLLLAISTRGS